MWNLKKLLRHRLIDSNSLSFSHYSECFEKFYTNFLEYRASTEDIYLEWNVCWPQHNVFDRWGTTLGPRAFRTGPDRITQGTINYFDQSDRRNSLMHAADHWKRYFSEMMSCRSLITDMVLVQLIPNSQLPLLSRKKSWNFTGLCPWTTPTVGLTDPQFSFSRIMSDIKTNWDVFQIVQFMSKNGVDQWKENCLGWCHLSSFFWLFCLNSH